MTKPSLFRYFKTSPEIIRLAVMLYIRFPLSLRNVEDLLHERGTCTGLVAYLCRSNCSFRPPCVRRPRGFSLPMLNADGAGYRIR